MQATLSSAITFQAIVVVSLHVSVVWNEQSIKLATAAFHTSFLTDKGDKMPAELQYTAQLF